MDIQACAQESTDGFVGLMEKGIGGRDWKDDGKGQRQEWERR